MKVCDDIVGEMPSEDGAITLRDIVIVQAQRAFFASHTPIIPTYHPRISGLSTRGGQKADLPSAWFTLESLTATIGFVR